jgi:hypothetical protein
MHLSSFPCTLQRKPRRIRSGREETVKHAVLGTTTRCRRSGQVKRKGAAKKKKKKLQKGARTGLPSRGGTFPRAAGARTCSAVLRALHAPVSLSRRGAGRRHQTVSSNVLYIYPLYPSFTVFSKRFHLLYLLSLQQRSLNHVLYM